MDAGLIAFIAGMIGLLVGVLSMNAVARSEREQERSLVSAPALRDGAAQVLAVIGRAYLVIDEVGLGFGTEAETRLLTQIIDARYRECLPTVLISNLDSQALSDAIGARALSRFADAPFVRFDWPDHRRTLAKQQKSNGEQS